MSVPSLAFLGFTASVAVLLLAIPVRWWRRAVLLAANIAFLWMLSPDPRTWLPFLGFLACGYASLRLVQARGRVAQWFFAPLCGAVLLVYVWLKQYTFLPSAAFLHVPYTVIGLSYVFFRVLHLIIDARNQALPDKVDPVSYLSFTLNFTSLVSGPIQRYQDYRPMEVSPVPLGLCSAGWAVERIVLGFFKVEVVSDLLQTLQTEALHALAPDQPLLLRVACGAAVAVSYPLYLYANFSGYTDVVIGAARFVGIALPENFDRPFSAENFINFWSRWHITLSTWLKTYVYSPLMLALCRRFPSRQAEPYWAVLAFFVTFFLIGVWHGRTSAFMAFGALQGLGVAGNKLYQISMANRLGRAGYRALCANPAYRALARGLTFTWFTFTLFWFWSDWPQMSAFVQALGGAALALLCTVVLLGASIVLAGVELVRSGSQAMRVGGEPLFASRYTRTVRCTALAVISVSVTTLLNLPAPDIVYGKF